MTDSAIEEELYRKLGKILVPAGYRFTKIDPYMEGFVRTSGGIKQSIAIPLWNYSPGFQFSLTFGIRIDAIEDIYHMFSGIRHQYHASSNTCLVNLNELVSDLDRMSISDSTTIQLAIDRLAYCFDNQIFRFLDEHRDIVSLDNLLNQPAASGENILRFAIKGSWILSFVMHAVVLARIGTNPAFDTLVAQYRSELLVFSDDDQQIYEKLVKYLRSLT